MYKYIYMTGNGDLLTWYFLMRSYVCTFARLQNKTSHCYYYNDPGPPLCHLDYMNKMKAEETYRGHAWLCSLGPLFVYVFKPKNKLVAVLPCDKTPCFCFPFRIKQQSNNWTSCYHFLTQSGPRWTKSVSPVRISTEFSMVIFLTQAIACHDR